MKITFKNNTIIFEKVLNDLDAFVIDFVEILDALKIKYVLISGYVAILFGRNRASEDIDIFIEPLDFTQFSNLWRVLAKELECIITHDVKDAYENYLKTNHAIRFSRQGEFLPNMEVKFPKAADEQWVLQHRKKVIVNKKTLFISPLEIQIAFKLLLGSEKDIEDARYLYKLFDNHLDKEQLTDMFKKLGVSTLAKRYL